MKQRFERCKTPMGSVPISVIMGFNYPLESDHEESGGEVSAKSTTTINNNYYSSVSTDYMKKNNDYYNYNRQQSTDYAKKNNYNSLNTDYMNRHMQDRLPRSSGANGGITSPLTQSRTPTQKTYLSRAATEARDLEPSRNSSSYSYGFTSSFALEHPKQQPCQYASALSMTARQTPQSRLCRAATVLPPTTSSVWRSNTFSQPRTTFSSYASKFSSPDHSYRFSNIRSRFA